MVLMKRKDFEFTLLELLIVIAIIALLASLLLPSLAKAKKRSDAIACAGNLRQLYAAELMYINDYNGCAMERLYGPSNQWAWYDTWASPFRTGGYIPLPRDGSSGGYVAGTVLDCRSVNDNPEANRAFEGSTDNHTHWTNYGYNYGVCRIKKIDKIKSPAKRVLFADATHYYMEYWDYNTKLYPAHEGAPNEVFVDGHVGWNKRFTYGCSLNEFRSWLEVTGVFD